MILSAIAERLKQLSAKGDSLERLTTVELIEAEAGILPGDRREEE